MTFLDNRSKFVPVLIWPKFSHVHENVYISNYSKIDSIICLLLSSIFVDNAKNEISLQMWGARGEEEGM